MTPSIIPGKIKKTRIASIKQTVEEIANEILEVCEEDLNLPIARFYLGGALYSETYWNGFTNFVLSFLLIAVNLQTLKK